MEVHTKIFLNFFFSFTTFTRHLTNSFFSLTIAPSVLMCLGMGSGLGCALRMLNTFQKHPLLETERQDERTSLGHGAVLHPCWTHLHVANVCIKATNTKTVSFGVKRFCCLPLCVGSLWTQKECHLRVRLVL